MSDPRVGPARPVRVVTRPAAILGRYVVEEGAETGASLLVGFHGYGENAEKHLEHLRRVPGTDPFRRVAVQALHRFYNTKTGEVVGSWMTRLDREQAVADNVAYVGAVVDALVREHAPRRLVYLGFSQGVAMAWRAAARVAAPCHGLIVLGGDLPPDVAEDPPPVLPPVLIGRGVRDEWYTEAKMARDLEALGRAGARVETVVFEGGHEWAEAFLAAASAFLERVEGGR